MCELISSLGWLWMYIIIQSERRKFIWSYHSYQYSTNFIGGFDQDYNIVFLKDATVTENEEMHKVELKLSFFTKFNELLINFFLKKGYLAQLGIWSGQNRYCYRGYWMAWQTC